MSSSDDKNNRHGATSERFRDLHVLLIEDESLVRLAVADMLESLGATVEEAASANEARERLELVRFGLVITDLHMPGKGGDKLALEIAEMWPELPVLIITGSGPHAHEARGLPCLGKPFVTADLAAAMQVVLARRLSGGADSPG